MCQVGIELAERGGGFEPDRLQERQIQIAGRAVTVVAVFRVLNVATHVQIVSQTAKQHKRPVVSAAMMVAGGTGHVNNHRIVEHRSITFGNAVELLRSIIPHIRGGGGGRPTMAQGGGSHAEGLDDALQAAKDFVQS